MHIYRWDLDRTYLETEIHSVRGLMRAALESAAEKRTVPGAQALIRDLLDDDPAARLFILSGSPQQMRSVLEEKLALDGVRVDRLVLKDNLGNLRRGRLRAVRGQVGYKLPRLLEDRTTADPSTSETLFGDDSETDAVIYAIYAEVVAGRMGVPDVVRLLEASRAYPDAIARAVAAIEQLGPATAGVEDIFIRIDRGVPLERFQLLGTQVIPMFSWWQASLVLHGRGRLPLAGVHAVAEACGLTDRPHAIAGLAQDTLRRGLVPPEDLESVLATEPFSRMSPNPWSLVARLGSSLAPQIPRPRPDYLAFLEAMADE